MPLQVQDHGLEVLKKSAVPIDGDTSELMLRVAVIEGGGGGGGVASDINLHDGAGTAVTSTTVGAAQALDVAIKEGTISFPDSFALDPISTSGIITNVSLDDTAWTPLPTTPLTNRKSIEIQNQSDNGNTILINYTALADAGQGRRILDGGTYQADIGPLIVLYGRMLSGTGMACVNEVS